VGVFRILEELIFKACDCSQAMEISYGAVAGLFVLVGTLLWWRRTRTKTEDEA
jgi:nitrate reductase gamma subunit